MDIIFKIICYDEGNKKYNSRHNLQARRRTKQ
jgi:hypothetical protein